MSSRSKTESILLAAEMAALAHHGQMYGDKPYITHPLAVAQLVACYGGTHDQVIAAILHDTLEDTDLDPDLILRGFGSAVASMVASLTHADGVSYEDYVAHLPDDAVLVKWADSTSNLSCLSNAPMAPERKTKLTLRYTHNVAVLDRRRAQTPPAS